MIDDSSEIAHARSAQSSFPVRRDPWQIHLGPIVLWLIVQMLALGLSAARVPLWARANQPIERLALEQLAIAQLVLVALLFPWMPRNRATGVAMILTAGPMIQLAAMLAQANARNAIVAWVYISAWLACAAMWQPLLRRAASQALALAVAGALVIGVPVARYLAAEFSSGSSVDLWKRWPIDPVTSLLRQLSESSTDARSWALLAVLSLGALVTRWLTVTRAFAPSYPQR